MYAGNSEHIADFVRIAHRSNRAMQNSRPSELARHQHRAFDMHMRVDKAGQKKGRGFFVNRLNRSDSALGKANLGGKHSTGGNVD